MSILSHIAKTGVPGYIFGLSSVITAQESLRNNTRAGPKVTKLAVVFMDLSDLKFHVKVWFSIFWDMFPVDMNKGAVGGGQL